VRDGTAYLTGTVRTAEEKQEAEKLALSVEGIDKVRNEIAKVASDPAFVEKNVIQRGLDPSFNTPEQFAQYLKEQRAQVDQTAKKANLQPQ
jgi:tripartite-type tricarboxylate transporter receptor subunit TctC